MSKKTGSAGRFGVRYGRSIRKKISEIEKKQLGWHLCPYCRTERVKREAMGVWRCRKCNTIFTGKAYEVV